MGTKTSAIIQQNNDIMRGPKKNPKTGKWDVDERPYGAKGKRFQRQFNTSSEANRFFKLIQAKAHENKEWMPNPLDKRHLSALVEKWYELHGYTLKTGKTKKSYLLANVELLGDPLAINFTSADFLTFRKRRLEDQITTAKRKVTIKPATVNYDLATLKAVFNVLINADDWSGDNPLSKVKLLKLDDNEMGFLTLDDIGVLLGFLSDTKSESVVMVSKICLSTGARWGEAQGLTGEQVRNGKVTFYKTKSHKKRTVPISKALEDEIFIDRKKTGPLFNYCYKTFLRALKKSGIELPEGQATHVLRHTFASHFIMSGGNIVTLSKILGHATIQMTMKYAHLAPEYLNDAVVKNALTLYESNALSEHKNWTDK